MADPSNTSGGRSKKGLDRNLIRRLLALLRPQRTYVLVALVGVVIAAYLGPLRPKLVQIAIDDHIAVGDLPGLNRIVLVLLGVMLAEGLLAFFNSYFTQWIGQRAIYELRVRIFNHLIRQPLAYFDRLPIGRLITRTTSDVEALSDVLSAGVVTILGDLLRIVFITWFMFALSPVLAVVTLAVLPLMFWATALFRKSVREQYSETRAQVARLNSFVQEHVTGMSVVQLFGREAEEDRRFAEINDAHRQAQLKTVFAFSLFFPVVEVLGSVALALVLWVGGLRAVGGGLTVGVLVAFIQYSRQFFEPIRNLSDQYNTLLGAMAGAERIFDVLDADERLPEKADAFVPTTMRGDIVFQNVWFAYDAAEADAEGREPNWILKDVSFTIPAGTMAAVVGATGAGKTTLINLLLRFYDVQKGAVLVDGVDVRDFQIEALRREIGLVLQDVFLFSGSVERNITLDDPDVTPERVREAATLIGADRFIERLPGGYAHDVKERGQGLSHGQRQMLSFVRALVYDPAVLVLDEATSSVDTETEEAIQTALERLMDGRTSLVVAHRLSTIQHADQILVMHRGELRETGTHAELLRRDDGLYRRLYELQYREERVEGRT
ncbi:MAG: ABC transporter ATP-binding protein/permease [Bacteroidetes bacterium]|nr:ABC transporter ATP-binding protein/permease [Bacteroidota bacterium]